MHAILIVTMTFGPICPMPHWFLDHTTDKHSRCRHVTKKSLAPARDANLSPKVSYVFKLLGVSPEKKSVFAKGTPRKYHSLSASISIIRCVFAHPKVAFPRDPQDRPKGLQEAPRWLQGAPKGVPRGPKMVPRSPQGSPRGLQGVSKGPQDEPR